MARGCHQLLRQGAKLVESAEDIFEELSSLLAFHQFVRNEPMSAESVPQDLFDHEAVQELTEQETLLLKLIGYDMVSVDGVVERSELSVEDVSFQLMSLELKGLIQSVPGGFQRCRELEPA